MANVTRLDAFRARRAGIAPPGPPPKPCYPAHLSATPGVVVMLLSDHHEVDLSPAQARIWAERLAAMADVAEGLEQDRGGR